MTPLGATFWTRALVSLGARIVNGVVYELLSEKVSCVKIEYIWESEGVDYPQYTSTTIGTTYEINDADSELSGEIFEDGFVPNDWGTDKLGVGLHNLTFPAYFVYIDTLEWEYIVG